METQRTEGTQMSLFSAPSLGPEIKEKKTILKLGESARKTIKAPGLSMARTAQACDRCRAKKSKCDGKVPACSSCAAIGIKCIVSDKLSRRAFPKGYTETLEERVRQLEAENTKLQGLLDLRDEQLALNSSFSLLESKAQDPSEDGSARPKSVSPDLLNPHSLLQSHNHDESCSCCSNPHAVHEKLVSLAGSVYNGGEEVPGSVFSDDETASLLSADDFVDFGGRYSNYLNREVSPAPGAFAAATAIEQMQKQRNFQGVQLNEENKQQLLTGLVAASIPRSTEETLFIPTLLARICQVYGYNSQPAIVTANALASLKENSHLAMRPLPQYYKHQDLLSLIMDNTGSKLKLEEAVTFIRYIQLPNKMELDYYLTLYFQQWGNVCPVLNKNSFLKSYVKLAAITDDNQYLNLNGAEANYELLEKVGALLVIVVSLAMTADKASGGKNGADLTDRMGNIGRYDRLIHEFIKPNCILTQFCSIQSLQILTLALQYCLAIGDVTTCYELRGRVITMAQQLRLHRCPAAVLGISKDYDNVNLQNFMQGERRILFWCIYCLDAYSSLNLGIPRLLKDHEIECAMPFSGKSDDDDDEKDNENILIINNTKLTIFGKVSKIALSMMQYCKVLGNIMDSVFSRSGNYDVMEQALQKDRTLDCWRRDLPLDLKFDIDVNGFSLKDGTNNKLNGGTDETTWNAYTKQQLLAIFLYYHAKVLIYLPIISKFGYHHNVGVSMKERLTTGKGDVSTVVSSMTMIQQSSIQILELLKSVSAGAHLLPVPINIPREQARFALLVAKGSLDYIKGGPLHQNLKQLLLDTLALFKSEAGRELPCCLTPNAVLLLEYAVLNILGLNTTRPNEANNLRKRIINNQSYTRMAVPRGAPYANGNQTLKQTNDVPNPNLDQWSPTTANPAQRDLNAALLLSTDEMVTAEGSLQDLPASGSSDKSTPDTASGSELVKEEQFDELEDVLNFQPFKVNYNNEMMIEEFVADGSLGLVPFLNDNARFPDEEDEKYDRTDDESGFQFGW